MLGFEFDGEVYYDTCMAMGCSSSCKTFEEFTTALQWIIEHTFGVKHSIHMIDDFLFIASNSSKCQDNPGIFQKVCHNLGVALAVDRPEGPSTTLVFLGIELNTGETMASLPQEKNQ